MSKLVEALKAAGWVEATLGECRPGEEILLTPAGPFPRPMWVTQPAEWVDEKESFVITSDGGDYPGTLPVLRAPRPEYAPGTVALVRWRGDKSLVRAWKVPGQWIPTGGIPMDDDDVEVVHVLLPADQDIPAVEVTDEMVERAGKALNARGWTYLGVHEPPCWCEDCKRVCTEDARATLEAALGVEKEK